VVVATVGACHALTGIKLSLHPDELRAAADAHLAALGLEQLQVLQLWWAEQNEVTFGEALDAMVEVVRAHKARQLALANVTLPQLEQALTTLPIAAIEAPLDDALVAACEQHGILYTPIVNHAPQSSTLELDAKRAGCTPAQFVIASLLARSPAILPVAAANKVVNLEEQIGAVHVALAA
jgi:aryl-alcohol dehydrogenase-like predicted oxidoreductase